MLIYQDMEDNIKPSINFDNCDWKNKLELIKDKNENETTENLYIPNTIIISKDKSYYENNELKICKNYYRVSYENFFKHKFIENDNHYYEVIPTNLPRYFYVDIDYDAEENKLFEPDIITKIEKDIIKYITKITKYLVSILKLKIELNNILSLSSSYEKKISLHIIFKDLKFINHKEFTNFTDNFINIKVSNDKRYDSEYKENIDESVYKKNQQFRFINQSKLKNPDIKLKLLTKKIKLEDTLIGIYKEEEQKDFITVKPRSNELVKKTKKEIEKTKEKNNKNFKHEYPKESDYCNYENEYDIILDIVPNCNEYTQTKKNWLLMGSILKEAYGDIIGLEKWKEWSSNCLIKYPKNIEKCNEYWQTVYNQDEYSLQFINKEYYEEYQKFRKYWDCKLLILDTQKFNDNITYVELNQRFLGNLNNMIQNYIINVIKSLTGTGKTKTIKEFLIENLRNEIYKSVLFVSTRRAMANSLTADFKEVNPNWKNYLEIMKENPKKEDQRRILNKCDFLTIQYESLYKLTRTYDVVVYDEIESILYQITSDTNINIPRNFDNTKKNFQKLNSLLQNCKKAILCDANIGKRTQLLINNLNKPTIFIENKFNNLREDNYKAINLGIYPAAKGVEKKTWFIHDIIEEINNNKNIFIVSGSNSCSKLLKREIKKETNLQENDILLYTSETNEDQFNHELSNVNTIWNTKRLIITTSKITNGVDFNQEHFHKVYVYISNVSCVVRDTLQTIRRIRYLKDKTIKYVIVECKKPINYIIKIDKLKQHIKSLNVNHDNFNNQLFLEIYQLNNIEKNNHFKYAETTTNEIFKESGYIIEEDNQYNINFRSKYFKVKNPLLYSKLNKINSKIDKEFINEKDYNKIIDLILTKQPIENLDIDSGIKTQLVSFVKKCILRLKYSIPSYDVVSNIYTDKKLYDMFEKYNLENSESYELENIDYSIYNIEKKILLNKIQIIKKIYEILDIKSLFTNKKIIVENEIKYYFKISKIEEKKLESYFEKNKKFIKETYQINYYNYNNVIKKIIGDWSDNNYIFDDNRFKIKSICNINELISYIDLGEYKFR